MRAIVTCGPSYEPIDRVRRITNLSTGELGVLLAERLSAMGVEVLCLKGVQATHPDPRPPVEVRRFTTNDHLQELLTDLATRPPWEALFHVAALCDYRVTCVEGAGGQAFTAAKIPSRSGSLVLHLEPARKVIAGLRSLFPRTWLVGWKYELDGTPAEALARGWRQIAECRLDACVVNGAATGGGYVLCLPPDRTEARPDKSEITGLLVKRLREQDGAQLDR